MDMKEINAGISGRYQAAARQVKRDNRTCGFIRSNFKMLVAGNDKGQRIGDPIYFSGPARLKDIKALQALPGVTNIHAQGEVRAYERITDDVEEGYEQWDYLVWHSPVPADERIDQLVRANTGFKSLPDMFDAAPSYRPSCDMREPVMREIADAYDARAELFGDPRRAYRYGA